MAYAHPMHLHLKKGALHKSLGVAEGSKIPAGKLSKALHSKNTLTRKRAQFAENAKHWHHGGNKGKAAHMPKSWHKKFEKTMGS